MFFVLPLNTSVHQIPMVHVNLLRVAARCQDHHSPPEVAEVGAIEGVGSGAGTAEAATATAQTTQTPLTSLVTTVTTAAMTRALQV